MDANSHIDLPEPSSGSAYRDLLAEVGSMFDDVLEKATIEAKTDVDRANARLLVLTEELDRRRVTETVHALSTTQWLRHRCRMTGREASGTLKTARALAQMPAVAEQAVTGQIVTSGVKLLTRARDRHPEEFVHHEPVLPDAATYLNARDLRIAVEHWDQQVDYETALNNVEDDAESRELFFNQTYQGKWDIQGRFGVSDGHVIHTALRGYIQRTYLDSDDKRSMPERLADASVGIHQHWLDHNNTVETSGGEKPHITVTVDYNTLTGNNKQLPELDAPLSRGAAEERQRRCRGITRSQPSSATRLLPYRARRPPSLEYSLVPPEGRTARGSTSVMVRCTSHHPLGQRRRHQPRQHPTPLPQTPHPNPPTRNITT